MKKFLSRKLVLSFIIFILLLVIAGVFIVIIKKDKGDDISNDDTTEVKEGEEQDEGGAVKTLRDVTTPEELEKCLETLTDSIVGTWEHFGSDSQYPPILTFRKKNTFLLTGWVSASYSSEGVWEFDRNKGTIKLSFEELDETWESLQSFPNLR